MERTNREVPNASYSDGESETKQAAVQVYVKPVHFSSFYLELDKTYSAQYRWFPSFLGSGS